LASWNRLFGGGQYPPVLSLYDEICYFLSFRKKDIVCLRSEEIGLIRIIILAPIRVMWPRAIIIKTNIIFRGEK